MAVTTTSLPNGQVGTAYSAALAATGGTTPYTWSLTSGTLPAGLSLSASGVISGTPTAAVNAASLTFKVTDSGQPAQSQSATLTLTITAAAPVITTTSLPNGQVGTAYSAMLAATGGTTPYTWSLTSGTLPAGLSLSASGVISGTPTATVNAASLTFKVTDSGQPAQSQSATLTLTITAAAPVITTTSLPNGQVGTAYSAALAATGGTTPYTWSLTSGTLPAGLSLSASGVISGTPTATVNAASLTFKVTDSGQPAQSQSATLTLTITAAAPVITTTSLPNGQVGTAYSAVLAATGGTTPYTWSLTSGTLPAGLSLSASGVISGTPTASVSTPAALVTTQMIIPAARANPIRHHQHHGQLITNRDDVRRDLANGPRTPVTHSGNWVLHARREQTPAAIRFRAFRTGWARPHQPVSIWASTVIPRVVPVRFFPALSRPARSLLRRAGHSVNISSCPTLSASTTYSGGLHHGQRCDSAGYR